MNHTDIRDLTFPSGGPGAGRATCRGSFLPADGPADTPRPCVVMAHGLGGTVDSGLMPFAEAFAAAGYATLAFDYRGFGRSDGQPRQVVSPSRQQDDFRAAIATAAGISSAPGTSTRSTLAPAASAVRRAPAISASAMAR